MRRFGRTLTWFYSSSARQNTLHGTKTVDIMAGDVTHTILAVEDRGLRLLAEGTTITLVAELDTTTTGNTVAVVVAAVAVAVAAAPAEGRGALKPTVLHCLQEGTRMIGTDSMATMEGEVERAMAIGKDAVLSLPSTWTDRKCTQLLSHALS